MKQYHYLCLNTRLARVRVFVKGGLVGQVATHVVVLVRKVPTNGFKFHPRERWAVFKLGVPWQTTKATFIQEMVVSRKKGTPILDPRYYSYHYGQPKRYL